MKMPQFAPSEVKTARAPITVKPSGLSCSAELYLVSNGAKVATSGIKPFTSTGVKQDVSFPITMPSAEGSYPVYLDIFANGLLIGAYQATEDVVIAPVAPVLAGEMSFIRVWHEPLTSWGIIWAKSGPYTEVWPDIPLNEPIYIIPYWNNTCEVSIIGHVDLEVTYPDGSKVFPSATAGQDAEALPGGSGGGVEFYSAFIATQEGTYTITVTLSSAGEILDSVTFTLVAAPVIPVEVYTCVYCGAQFTTESDLVAHMEANHPGKPYIVWASLPEKNVLLTPAQSYSIKAKVFAPATVVGESYRFAFWSYQWECIAGFIVVGGGTPAGFYTGEASSYHCLHRLGRWYCPPLGENIVRSDCYFTYPGMPGRWYDNPAWKSVDIGLRVNFIA